MDFDNDHPSFRFSLKVSGSKFLLLYFRKIDLVNFSHLYKVYPNIYQVIADYTSVFKYCMADLKE